MIKKSKLIEILDLQVRSQDLGHAYLVLGSVLVDEVKKLLQIQNSDLLVLQENPIKISHIRELIHFAHIKPHSSVRKLIVLLNIENMTLDSANCLLKILEEPPESNIIILQSERKEKILSTIISRCQLIREKSSENIEDDKTLISSQKLAQMTIYERFDYINSILKAESKEKIVRLLNFWEAELREKLLQGKDCRSVLNKVSKTRSLLFTNSSVKLLLENLILEF